jgi:glycosyltransferase involved in cell wall biosynthesis
MRTRGSRPILGLSRRYFGRLRELRRRFRALRSTLVEGLWQARRGFRALVLTARQRGELPPLASQLRRPGTALPRLLPAEAAVSVVVPVKNAGPGLADLLDSLQRQKGFKDIELVVVDSGSTDGSVGVAQRYGAKLLEILPEEFSHSYARNLGAEHASGDVLLFTVQDALPPEDTWLAEMFAPLARDGVAAVSCDEHPREDADLFYRVLSWSHRRYLELDRGDRITSKPATNDPDALRKNAQLTDVACLIRRDLFLRYRHRGDFAEDLDLGLRLIRDGYRLALLASTWILHSHNRPPWYHLRRSYVDTLALLRLLPGHPRLSIAPDRLFADIVAAAAALESMAEDPLRRLTPPLSVAKLAEALRGAFAHRAGRHAGPLQLATPDLADDAFADFLRAIERQASDADALGPGKPVDVLTAVRHVVDVGLEYLQTAHQFVDAPLLAEVRAFGWKALALRCGSHLAHCVAGGSDQTLERLRPLDRRLTAGV